MSPVHALVQLVVFVVVKSSPLNIIEISQIVCGIVLMRNVCHRLRLWLANIWWMDVVHHWIWVVVALQFGMVGIVLLKLCLQPLVRSHCQVWSIHVGVLPWWVSKILLTRSVASVEILHGVVWLLGSHMILIHGIISHCKLVSLLHLAWSTSQTEVIWHWDIVSRQARPAIVNW